MYLLFDDMHNHIFKRCLRWIARKPRKVRAFFSGVRAIFSAMLAERIIGWKVTIVKFRMILVVMCHGRAQKIG